MGSSWRGCCRGFYSTANGSWSVIDSPVSHGARQIVRVGPNLISNPDVHEVGKVSGTGYGALNLDKWRLEAGRPGKYTRDLAR